TGHHGHKLGIRGIRMKKLLFLLIAALIVFMLAACTATEDAGKDPEEKDKVEEPAENGDTTDDAASDEKVLRLNNSTEPTSLDPSIGFDAVSWDPLNNLMEGLTR